ncbi:PEP-CTERM sorting domain-containing protein [Massilia yuzhufengensis]|uniref:PEP-CTERM protein-sorting domain-containing protein n=1 Tax=Massilia yuzhufengensis TaxID=1164594 RepID=A0A1I1KWQ1_9BURK|nr:PEP-CTERM sorting domain-containing protein [Massilia yuzhufengensis]SFC65237.1 PEP-CTERM protein-sorting domain-containing protein [Massilia yuzhufengensis]
MKTKIILETLVLAAALTATQAGAAPISLQGSTITGTYNGAPEGVFGLDYGFAAEPGSNTTAIDPFGTGGVEFLTSDFLFGIDFSTDGILTVMLNATLPDPGNYRLAFDFGADFAQRIGGFSWLDTSGVTGLPALTVLNGHSFAIDLSPVSWNSEIGVFSAQIDAAAAVPEPGSIGLALAGLTGFALARRRNRAAQR